MKQRIEAIVLLVALTLTLLLMLVGCTRKNGWHCKMAPPTVRNDDGELYRYGFHVKCVQE